MKKYTSTLMLYAHSTIFHLLGILVLTGIAEITLFFHAADPSLPLEEVFFNSHISWICGISFLLWTITLSLPTCSKSGYTIRRMQVTPCMLFLCHTIYNALCNVLFWSFHVCLLLILFHRFGTGTDVDLFGPQSILLAFYRIHFLHSLLPLADWTLYIRNGCFALLLGAAAAYPLFCRGSISSQITMAAFFLVLLWLFPTSMASSNMNLVLSVLSVICLSIFIWIAKSPHEEPGHSAASSIPDPDVFKEALEDEL